MDLSVCGTSIRAINAPIFRIHNPYVSTELLQIFVIKIFIINLYLNFKNY